MKLQLSEFIVVDSEVCHGKPVFKGTRILVSDVLELLASDFPIERILKEYPNLTKEMILDALGYAAKVIKGEAYVKYTEIPARRKCSKSG